MRIIFLFLSCFFLLEVSGQEGFCFDSDKKRLTIPFTHINNLILLEASVNDVPMTFLLDTGVQETILFSLENVEEAEFLNIDKVRFRGLGNADSVEGLKSSGNSISIALDFKDKNHDIYIIMDEDFNISSSLGVPVNGILGSNFFKNHIIEIDYIRDKIYVYEDINSIKKRVNKRFQKFDIVIEKDKPYMIADIVMDNTTFSSKLLIDTGNSDAIWLFQNKIDSTLIPKDYFEDFLGRGFSGEVYGKRAKLDRLIFDTFEFKQPYVAFPDTTSVRNVNMVQNRSGSVGAEILKRFTVIFDYQSNVVYLRPNSNYKLPFHFNMSGIEVHHHGLQWVSETIRLRTDSQTEGINVLSDVFRYRFELKPVFKIYGLRPDSPAFLAGLQKGDELVSINGKKAYNYTLQQINTLLKSKEGKKITLRIKREDTLLKYTFYLKSILK